MHCFRSGVYILQLFLLNDMLDIKSVSLPCWRVEKYTTTTKWWS